VQQLNLLCKSDLTVGWIGSTIFLGWAIASIVLPRISDIYGRKYLFLGLMVLNFVVGVVLLFSRSIWLTMGMQFLVGWVAVGRWTIGYIMLQEFVPQS
jgi:MFS family permease